MHLIKYIKIYDDRNKVNSLMILTKKNIKKKCLYIFSKFKITVVRNCIFTTPAYYLKSWSVDS